ncbi:MAG: FABP family protein [Actinomycetia bacterium]|nr:FABP family protein [Actinomycetes bacterium]
MTTHPDIASLTFLVGTWEGEGVGIYPTIDDFSYREEVTFIAPPGKPFLKYTQMTWRAGDRPDAGTPLHTEAGFFRSGGAGRAEATMAQPTGIVEVYEGTVEGTSLRLRTTTVERTSTAKEVLSVERNIDVDGVVLSYEMWMGAVGQPHQLHLKAELRRS